MTHKVVAIKAKPASVSRMPITDFWFAQVEVRLSRVERMLTRIEWQIWAVVLTAGALLGLEIVRALAPVAQ